MRGEKCAKSDVVKLFFIISLECEYGATELGGDIGIKAVSVAKASDLRRRGKVHIMRIIN